ncbi:ModE family transcriptional regulator [Hydrogenovibrio sp. SC-1]|uniref:TOBE domain-containing protein n=1 Tax=Hydrogenovibrio sp. SC-1 TaxID=2065820 RepID=UPI000C7CAA5C|nr:TOBE domain-containing protein [Hydrogenovibrio sp. SC-1]PLA74234.1 ModE family transcriptional regulator [Hydrogenovibrio sp. SC-1]
MSQSDSMPAFYAPWHLHFDGGDISPRRLHLLQAIESTGSVSQAAKQVGMSYKAAWDAVEIINNLADVPLVHRQHGGKGGGGATLTQKGLQIVSLYERLSAMQAQWMASLEAADADVLPLMRRMKMQTSARNTFYGSVEAIKTGAVNAEVTLKLQGDDRIVATVTTDSIERMNLTKGKVAWALVKASWVILASPMASGQTSARNTLCGEVSRITEGPVNVEVIVALKGGNTLAAIITRSALEEMQLSVGKPVCALIKASHVLMGVDA